MRSLSAYITPSAIFVGIAVHEMIHAFFLLLKKYEKAGHTAIYRIAIAIYLLVLVYISLEITILDYQASPFVTLNSTGDIVEEPFPFTLMGSVLFTSYIVNMLIDLGIYAMALIRLVSFYDMGSKVFRVMATFAVLNWLLKTAGCTIGAHLSIKLLKEHKLFGYYDPSPIEGLQNTLFAIVQSSEAVWFLASSLMFIIGLSRELGLHTKRVLFAVFIEREGLRYIAIAFLNILMASFAAYSAAHNGTHTYVTRTALYLSSLAYATEFHTYLLTSYVSVKAIIEDSRETHIAQFRQKGSCTSRKGSFHSNI